MNKSIIKAVFFSLAGYFAMALASIFTKGLSQVPTTTILFWQFGTALMLTLLTVKRDGVLGLKTSHPYLMLMRCVSGSLAFLTMFYAIKHMPVVNAVLLQNTAPIFVPFVMYIWHKKHISPLLWIGILIGFIGIIFILKPHLNTFTNWTALIGLSAGIFTAISAVVIGKLKQTEPTKRILFYLFLSGACMIAPFTYLNWLPLSLTAVLLMTLSGGLLYGAVTLVTHAFRYARTTTLAPLSYATVVFTGLLSMIFWQQIPDILTFLGIVLVIVGGVATILIEHLPKREKKSTLLFSLRTY